MSLGSGLSNKWKLPCLILEGDINLSARVFSIKSAKSNSLFCHSFFYFFYMSLFALIFHCKILSCISARCVLQCSCVLLCVAGPIQRGPWSLWQSCVYSWIQKHCPESAHCGRSHCYKVAVFFSHTQTFKLKAQNLPNESFSLPLISIMFFIP